MPHNGAYSSHINRPVMSRSVTDRRTGGSRNGNGGRSNQGGGGDHTHQFEHKHRHSIPGAGNTGYNDQYDNYYDQQYGTDTFTFGSGVHRHASPYQGGISPAGGGRRPRRIINNRRGGRGR